MSVEDLMWGGSNTDKEKRGAMKVGYRGGAWGWELKCHNVLKTGSGIDCWKQAVGNCEGKLKKKMTIHKNRWSPWGKRGGRMNKWRRKKEKREAGMGYTFLRMASGPSGTVLSWFPSAPPWALYTGGWGRGHCQETVWTGMSVGHLRAAHDPIFNIAGQSAAKPSTANICD